MDVFEDPKKQNLTLVMNRTQTEANDLVWELNESADKAISHLARTFETYD